MLSASHPSRSTWSAAQCSCAFPLAGGIALVSATLLASRHHLDIGPVLTYLKVSAGSRSANDEADAGYSVPCPAATVLEAH